MIRRVALYALFLCLGMFGLMVGCSGDESNSGLPAGEGASSGTSTGAGTGEGGDLFSDAGTTDSGLDEDSACASQSADATLESKPVDIIFVIDNSGSMGQEILAVQNNINQSFASIIGASGIDYRVIMVARHGDWNGPESVCIEAPLSGIAQGGCSPPPAQPVNSANFFHYSVEISSHNSFCQILDTFNAPDEHNLAPNGWQAWLRPDSFKIFVEITDDGVSCTSSTTSGNFNDGNQIVAGQTAAANFDTALLTLSPTHFGTAMDRNYRWYSLIALENKDQNNPATPWLPSDPLTTGECPTAADPGTGYQALSVLTEGLRFPLCEPNYYNVVFNEIAQGIIDGASIDCEFPVPDPPPGETLDLQSVIVEFTPSNGPPVNFQQVPSANDCGPNMFYIDQGTIYLCPETCDTVSNDEMGSLRILFGCVGDVN